MPGLPPRSARNVLNISADLSYCKGLAMSRCTMSLPADITGQRRVEKERPLPWKRAFAGFEAGRLSVANFARFDPALFLEGSRHGMDTSFDTDALLKGDDVRLLALSRGN